MITVVESEVQDEFPEFYLEILRGVGSWVGSDFLYLCLDVQMPIPWVLCTPHSSHLLILNTIKPGCFLESFCSSL